MKKKMQEYLYNRYKDCPRMKFYENLLEDNRKFFRTIWNLALPFPNTTQILHFLKQMGVVLCWECEIKDTEVRFIISTAKTKRPFTVQFSF